jgi:hypothetical protein
MADFTLSKPIFGGKQPKTSTAGNIAYALFVLFCFWAGSQLLNMLVHAPGVYEHLMQVQDTDARRLRLVWRQHPVWPDSFLAGCMILGVVALVLRWRRRHR